MSHRLFILSLVALQSEVFFGCRRGGLAGERRPNDAAVLVELHAQGEAHLHQYILDLVERLAAEVFGLQHFIFALLDELADGLDVGVLQAVVGAHGKLELLDGAVEMFEARIVGGVRRRFDGFDGLFEIDKDAHVVLDELGGEADGILRGDGAVGPHFDHQLFVVGHLAEASGFNGVINLAHRGVNAVHGNVADGQIFVIVAVGGNVAAAVLDAHFDLELAAFADGGDVHAFVEDGEVRVFLDLRGGDRTGLLDVDVNGLGQVGVELDGHLLQVEDDVGGILDHAGDRRKFVQHAFDLHGGDGRAFDGAEQRATQRISYGRAPAALKRLRGKPPVLLGERFQLGCKTLRLLKTLPHRVPSFWPECPDLKPNTMPGSRARWRWPRRCETYFEYSSTMSCSLLGGVCTSSRFGIATTLALNCSRVCSSQGTAFWLCATLRASSTMAFWCIFSLMATSSPTLTR